jgi:glutathione S-transferase
MAIKLYGIPQSRAARCLWTLEELGIPYESIAVDFRGEAQTPEFLKINPNGHVPALDDDGLVLFESLAINLHLARKYGAASSLWPESPEDQSLSIQWSFWAITELEPLIIKLLMNRLFLPEAQRVEAEVIAAERGFQKPVNVLEGALRGRTYLLGDAFSVADLNVFALLAWDHLALRTPYLDVLEANTAAGVGSLRLDDGSGVAKWARRCGERAALHRVLAMRLKQTWR